jgi:hypothetical protein
MDEKMARPAVTGRKLVRKRDRDLTTFPGG